MPSVTELARQLRRNMTEAELQLWAEVRNRNLGGYKFTRQTPIFYQSPIPNKRAFFIADFFCSEKQLVIELDGGVHEYQKEYDSNRDEILASLGLRTLRIKNEELADMDSVKSRVLEVIAAE